MTGSVVTSCLPPSAIAENSSNVRIFSSCLRLMSACS